MIRKALHTSKTCLGQSIYQTLLIIACAALLVGSILAGFEIYAIYQTDMAIQKLQGGIPRAGRSTPAPTAPTPKEPSEENSEEAPAPVDETGKAGKAAPKGAGED